MLAMKAFEVSAFLVRVVNVSYWFTGPVTAIYWLEVMPLWLLFTLRLPFVFNTQVMMTGCLVIMLVQWIMTNIVQSWAGVSDLYIWRGQQNWFALWPLVISSFILVSKSKLGKPSWKPSSLQTKLVFVVNVIELGLFVSGIIYSMFSLRTIMNDHLLDHSNMSAMLLGLLLTFYSINLQFQVTYFLFSVYFHNLKKYFFPAAIPNRFDKTDSVGREMSISMRHYMVLLLLIWCLILWFYQGSQWEWSQFSQIFTKGVPHMR
ncbi:hypothetical protein SAMD00019534_089320 [Acytostelium subglobosum LB1]|uniref:hypothetical protein n=1 Tax=Acytostelium subglobosum LB1 TaxID=1410327 RepID=UPI0006451E72|nr:hypothetical protein SAMD00019534_089320 [Acytostelium subglobosum LB1]GAM25757.1 hypothetical protein SAMD00019534_089320 [Acytostelium subglobosum LB1]|eukprot:XP_012751275.1 hypothetical protein SAMD00019534_089320 [Acytostelium subglobosum LB1]